MLHRTVQRLVCLRAFRAGRGLYTLTVPAEPEINDVSRECVPGEDRSAAGAGAAVPPPPDGTRDSVPREDQRLVRVGVVGVPNAGKSTLTNALVGTKVSAVSAKTNTTRRSVLGAFTVDTSQVVIYDTPGILGPGNYKSSSDEYRVRSAWATAAECDRLLLILDAHRQLSRPDPRVIRLVTNFGTSAMPAGIGAIPPAALVLNKVDQVPREQRPALLSLANDLQKLHAFEEVFWVSALRGHGIDELRGYLLEQAVPGVWAVDSEEATDTSEAGVALEVVREKVFRMFYAEVPYQLQVSLVSWSVLRDGSCRVEMDVVTPTQSVRKIVVGRAGQAIRAVGTAARLELEKMWHKRVHLILNVKCNKPRAS